MSAESYWESGSSSDTAGLGGEGPSAPGAFKVDQVIQPKEAEAGG